MSGLFVPPERVSVRYAATGLIEALAGAEFVHRVRDGRIGATDRVERDDGVFVRWTMDRRFSALAAELGLDTGATGPVPRVTTPSGAPAAVASSPRTAETRITGQSDAVRSSMGRQGATPSGSLRSVGSDPEAALRAARQRMGQTRAVDQTVERIRALQQSSGSAAVASGPASGPHPVALRSVLTADLLSSGPEVVRDILLQTPLTEILGVDAATQGRRLDSIRAQLCNQLESMWPSNSDELRTAESRAARVDALRIVTAAHRVLSAPAE